MHDSVNQMLSELERNSELAFSFFVRISRNPGSKLANPFPWIPKQSALPGVPPVTFLRAGPVFLSHCPGSSRPCLFMVHAQLSPDGRVMDGTVPPASVPGPGFKLANIILECPIVQG